MSEHTMVFVQDCGKILWGTWVSMEYVSTLLLFQAPAL